MDDDEEDVCDQTCFLSNGKRKFMRVFITYEGERTSIDIPLGASVGKIKSLIIKKMLIPQSNIHLGNENQVKKVLVLNYAGAELSDNLILSDLSIPPGSTLRAYMKDQMDPILYFKIGYNQNTIPVLEKMKLQDLSVADLRSLASKKSGLPCSIFRMVTENGKDMFDCYMVDAYDIHPNSVIKIETWDGWNEFLHLSSLGFTTYVLEKIIPDDDILARYQMKVAMFIAAHFGHVDLAVTLCRHGIKPGEPVGLHPLRQWCPNNQHIEILKPPIHEAVECGQLSVLRSFVHHSITSIFSKDGYGLQPLNIALRRKVKNCASFLLSKQWSRVSFNGNTITLSVFSKLKLWAEKAREKASLNPNAEKTSTKRKIFRSFPLVGQGMYIDGFSTDQISSRSKFPSKKKMKHINIESYYQNLYGINPEHYFKSLDILNSKSHKSQYINHSGIRKVGRITSGKIESHSDIPDGTTKENQLKLPKLGKDNIKSNELQSRPPSNFSTEALPIAQKTTFSKSKKNKKPQDSMPLIDNKVESTLPLPLKSTDHTPRPYYYIASTQIDDISRSIESYYKERGYLPREYAIKCLTLTNQLKERTWLSQVRIAMKLGQESVKKSIGSQPDSILTF